jgi:hypothetical protein
MGGMRMSIGKCEKVCPILDLGLTPVLRIPLLTHLNLEASSTLSIS